MGLPLPLEALAHPRVGGENHWAAVYAPVATGSSPRGRGKLRVVVGMAGFAGLIPAWAGKTRFGTAFVSSAAAHPRVGGENTSAARSKLGKPGSSPRGRGKPRAAVGLPAGPGLIPAWAGKTRAGGR